MKKLVLAQIDTILTVLTMTNYQPGIWWQKLTMTADEKLASPLYTVLGADLSAINENELTIGSVIIEAEQYSQVSSLAEMYIQSKSFLWDQTNQILYIRFDDPYWIFGTITAGKVIGFLNQAQADEAGFPTDCFIGAVYYEPRLKIDSVSCEQSIDPLQWGVMQYDEISFEVDNSDGEYDNLNELTAGQGLRLLYASCDDNDTIEAADFTTFRRGYVETVNFKGSDTLVVQGQDLRKKWTNKINDEFLTQTEYSDLDDKNVDKRKPLCIGVCYNVPCIQIETSAPKFLFSTDTYGNMVSVDQVYVDGVATAHTGTETDGTFIIAGYTSGDVTADVTGVDKGTDVEKILFLLDQFKNISYIASNFNIGEVDIAISNSKTGGYYIGTSGKTLQKCIEELLQNIGGNLIPQGDKLTIRIYDVDRTESREIFLDEMDGFPDRLYDETEFYSSVTTYYHRDEDEDEYYSYYDDSQEGDAIDNQYRLENKEIYTTLLTEADAADIGDRFYDRFIDIPVTIEAKMLIDVGNYYPGDVLAYEHKRNNGTVIIPRANYEITSYDRIGQTLTLSYMKDNPAPVYTKNFLTNHYLSNNFLTGGLS